MLKMLYEGVTDLESENFDKGNKIFHNIVSVTARLLFLLICSPKSIKEFVALVKSLYFCFQKKADNETCHTTR